MGGIEIHRVALASQFDDRTSGGVADCEIRDGWFWQQDVNTGSSIAYILVAIVLAEAVRRGRLQRSLLTLSVVTALQGVGSAAYHASSSGVAQWLHDLPLIGIVGYFAGWHVGRLVGVAGRGAGIGSVGGMIAGGMIWPAWHGVVLVAILISVVVLIAAELIVRARGQAVVWGAPLIVLAVVAGLTWLGGRSDSPLCVPQSWVQSHGLWHVASAALLLAWVDAAEAAIAPDRAPRLWRHGIDRCLGLAARLLVHAFHRSLEVAGRDRAAINRPAIIVANHGNGFVDPLVVAALLGRLPRFLAKASLWKVVPARPFLALAGVLPVHRSQDGDRASGNLSTFAACRRELAGGATVAVFPEGTTSDRAELDRVRRGAARIALESVGSAPGLVVLPIGLAFESSIKTRTRAVAIVGDPIDVATWSGRPSSDSSYGSDRNDVKQLTGAIAKALRDVSPEFDSVDEREMLRAVARTTLNTTSLRSEPTFGEIEVLARRLASAPAKSRSDMMDGYRHYAARLQLLGLRDRDVRSKHREFLRVSASVAALAVFGSLVIAATVIHLPAIIIVVLAATLARSPVSKGTIRVLVGLVTGLATWVIAGIVLADGFGAVVAAVLVAVGGILALAIWTPLVRAIATLGTWFKVRNRAHLMPALIEERARVAALVWAAIDSERAGLPGTLIERP